LTSVRIIRTINRFWLAFLIALAYSNRNNEASGEEKKRVKRLITLLLLFCLVSASLFAQDSGFNSKREVREFCEAVLRNMANGKFEAGFNLLRAHWLFPKEEIDSVERETNNQLTTITNRYGEPIDYAFIKEEQAGEVAVRYIYAVTYAKHLIRWLFTFYKPKEIWFLNSFNWDDAIEKLF